MTRRMERVDATTRTGWSIGGIGAVALMVALAVMPPAVEAQVPQQPPAVVAPAPVDRPVIQAPAAAPAPPAPVAAAGQAHAPPASVKPGTNDRYIAVAVRRQLENEHFLRKPIDDEGQVVVDTAHHTDPHHRLHVSRGYATLAGCG